MSSKLSDKNALDTSIKTDNNTNNVRARIKRTSNTSNNTSKISNTSTPKVSDNNNKQFSPDSSNSSRPHNIPAKNTTDFNMYVSQEQLNGFNSYKYNCVDDSPISIYVMHPFWNWCVKFCPKNIAPNLLTIAGFSFTILQYILLSIYDPTFTAQTQSTPESTNPSTSQDLSETLIVQIPSIIWIICAFSQFMAHTLDGIDGKQARTIGMTGPLGELFDHGIDAWSCSFIAMSVFSTIGVNPNPDRGLTMVDMFVSLWMLQLVFYVAHWEKFVTGVLYLPWTYDLSMIALMGLYLWVAAFGSSFWTVPLMENSPVPFLFKTVTVLNITRTVFLITSTFSILTAVYKVFIAKSQGKSSRNVKEIITPWISMVLAIFLFALWTFNGPYTQSINIYHPRSVLLGNGVIFANIVARLIICQMSHTKPRPIVHPFCLVVFVFFVLDKFLIHHAYISTILWPVCVAVLVIGQIHFAYMVINILARHYNIWPFSTKKRTVSSANYRPIDTSDDEFSQAAV